MRMGTIVVRDGVVIVAVAAVASGSSGSSAGRGEQQWHHASQQCREPAVAESAAEKGQRRGREFIHSLHVHTACAQNPHAIPHVIGFGLLGWASELSGLATNSGHRGPDSGQ